jgi:hypothetical protein
MTAHIAAYPYFGARGRLQIEMGVKACNTLQLEERQMKARRERTKLVGGQVPMPFLNGSQLVKDWGMMR